MNRKTLYSFLIFCGVLPFIFTAAAPYFGLERVAFIDDIQYAGALYGLLIVSFMAGIHWGLAVQDGDGRIADPLAVRLMLASNLYALVPWVVFLVSEFSSLFYISLLVAFLLLLITDRQLKVIGVLSEHYYRTRRLITVVVIASLILIAAS